jgi:hypothetical protein
MTQLAGRQDGADSRTASATEPDPLSAPVPNACRRFEAQTWWSPSRPEAMERVVERLLGRVGLRRVEFAAFTEGHGLRMTGGSRFAVRILGARLVSPKRVPKEVRLWITWDAQGPRLCAEVRDTLDAGRVRSERLRLCYARVASEIFHAIEAVI